MAASKRKRSSLKRIRQNVRRAAQNRSVRSAIRSMTKRAKAEGTEVLAAAQSSIDKAVRSGVIHRNQAARRKSRLMKAVAKRPAKA